MEGVGGKDVSRSNAERRIGVGSKLMRFPVPSLPPDRWHHLLVVLSIHLTPPPPLQPTHPSFTQREREGGEIQEKTVYFRAGLLIYLDWA